MNSDSIPESNDDILDVEEITIDNIEYLIDDNGVVYDKYNENDLVIVGVYNREKEMWVKDI